jgi:hypothetical protein
VGCTTVFKLLTMLMAFLLVALGLLGLRQRRLELTSESAKIYSQIRERHESLLDQRVEIAKITNPKALATSLEASGVNTGAALHLRGSTVNRSGNSPTGIETDLTAPVRQRP